MGGRGPCPVVLVSHSGPLRGPSARVPLNPVAGFAIGAIDDPDGATRPHPSPWLPFASPRAGRARGGYAIKEAY